MDILSFVSWLRHLLNSISSTAARRSGEPSERPLSKLRNSAPSKTFRWLRNNGLVAAVATVTARYLFASIVVLFQ